MFGLLAVCHGKSYVHNASLKNDFAQYFFEVYWVKQ